jgi:hypothetical protein
MILRYVMARSPNMARWLILAYALAALLGLVAAMIGWVAGDPLRTPGIAAGLVTGAVCAIECGVFAYWLHRTGRFWDPIGGPR